LIQEEQIDGVRVIRTWMYLTANEGFVRRTLNYVLFALAAVLSSFRTESPDVVVATSPQFFCGIAGAVIARLKRRPFVLEVRDLWPDSIVELGQLRGKRTIQFLRAVETRLYRSASGIVVNTQAFVAHIRARGIPVDRITVIYNGIDLRMFSPRSPSQELRQAYGLQNQFVAAYIGTLGLAHGLMTIVDAAERLRGCEDIVFLLLGDGAARGQVEAEISRRGLSNVHVLGLRPRTEMPAWIASVDVTLVLLRDLPVFETVIPSKIFEFLAQERPVIVAARGEIRRLVDEAKAGLLIDPEHPDQLVSAVLEVRDQPEAARARARAGREWVEASFDRDALARRMADFLGRVAGANP
jgi:glycosyltransferase involved in cell wall biosynthesis